MADETCLDVLVDEWTRQFDWHVRRSDRPRDVGRTPGTGIYLRTLRSRTYYMRDREDVERLQANIRSRQPPRGFRVQQWELDKYNRLQQTLPVIDAYLSLPPPDVSAMHQAMSHWLEVARGSGKPGVSPFAALDLPTPPEHTS
jgi:hypothetical protein